MSKMLGHHTQAMDLAAQATIGFPMEPVDESRRRELFKQALASGLKAITELDKLEYHDLTYSVIHRSIAATALDCGEYQLAEQLAAKPIARGPHPSIVRELRDVMHKAEFQQRLEDEGLTLAMDEIEMSLDGPAVGNDGIISWSDWRRRISTVMDFMEKTVRKATIRPPIFISRPRSSSFAVSIRLGSPIESHDAFENMDPVPAYIEKFMNSMSAVNQLDLQYLQTQFDDPNDRKSFLDTARGIAPDGKRVANVNFTQTRPSRETRTVAITKTVSDLPRPAELRDTGHQKEEKEEETLFGRLLFADGRDESKSQIRIVRGELDALINIPDDKDVYDIVEQMWNCDVAVVAGRFSGNLELKEIRLVQPDMFTLTP